MKITQYKLFPVWQSEKEEQWLNRMAQQGIYVAPTQKKIIAAGVVYLVTVLAFYRFYAGVWAPKKGENSRCQS